MSNLSNSNLGTDLLTLQEGRKYTIQDPKLGEVTIKLVFPIGSTCIAVTSCGDEVYLPATGWVQSKYATEYSCGEYKLNI